MLFADKETSYLHVQNFWVTGKMNVFGRTDIYRLPHDFQQSGHGEPHTMLQVLNGSDKIQVEKAETSIRIFILGSRLVNDM